MRRAVRRKGEPLRALAAIMGAWVVARGLLCGLPQAEAHFAPPGVGEQMALASWSPQGAVSMPDLPHLMAEFAAVARRRALSTRKGHGGLIAVPSPVDPGESSPAVPDQAAMAPFAGEEPGGVRAATYVSPVEQGEPVLPPGTGRADVRGVLSRWSADGWFLWRRGGGYPGAGAAFATYGASQTGAVLRYRLAPGDAHGLAAYVRAYGALNGSGEREAAAGLQLRPLAGVPLLLLGEGRASRFSNGTVHLRPAVTLVTQVPPLRLPMDARGELYVQGGYVGGAAATPFVDGQLRVDRSLAAFGREAVRLGGGIWGGAQEGVRRLDMGPSAVLGLGAGRLGARLAFDWRFRVAGNAQPASGPAITLSAGF